MPEIGAELSAESLGEMGQLGIGAQRWDRGAVSCTGGGGFVHVGFDCPLHHTHAHQSGGGEPTYVRAQARGLGLKFKL